MDPACNTGASQAHSHGHTDTDTHTHTHKTTHTRLLLPSGYKTSSKEAENGENEDVYENKRTAWQEDQWEVTIIVVEKQKISHAFHDRH